MKIATGVRNAGLLLAMTAVLSGCVLGEPGDGPDPYRFGAFINIDGGLNTSHEIVMDARDANPRRDGVSESRISRQQQVGALGVAFSVQDAESVPDEYCLQGDFEVFDIGPPRELIAFRPAGTCLQNGESVIAPPPG
jgi:hypothetical protein